MPGMSSLHLFRYLPLNHEGDIRLLTLLPGNFTDSIHIVLQSVNLENNTKPYEALSYAWGVERTRVVSSEGSTIETPTNLSLALRYIRSETESLVLWADAICIDQTNPIERSRQVSLMDQVYQRASRVLIWLGEGEQGETNSVKWFLETLRSTSEKQMLSYFETDLEKEILRENFRMLSSLLSRPWFHRGWTTQEVCLARHAVMMNGRNRMDWEELLNLYKELYRNARGLAQRIFDRDHRAAKSKVARSLRMSKFLDPSARSLPFSYILSLSDKEETTDPKDKVYAALALVAEPIRRSIVVDYTKRVSIEEVYTEATRAIIAYEKRYYILSQVESIHRDPKIPSWVPDWRVKRLAENMFAVKHRGCTHGIQAATLDITPSPSELPVLAHQVGQVIAVYDLEPLRSDLKAAARQGWTKIAAAIINFAVRVWSDEHILCQDASSYLTILRTLTADTLPFSDRISDDMRYRYFPVHKDCLLNGVRFSEATSGVLTTYYASMFETCCQQQNTTTCSYDQHTKFPPLLGVEDVLMSNAIEEIVTQILVNTSHRSLFTTNGRIGLACTSTAFGDEVYCFQGGAVPFLLRPTAKVGTFELVAECYLDGAMMGELYTIEDDGKRRRLIPRDGKPFSTIALI